jgi:hypothetical protein
MMPQEPIVPRLANQMPFIVPQPPTAVPQVPGGPYGDPKREADGAAHDEIRRQAQQAAEDARRRRTSGGGSGGAGSSGHWPWDDGTGVPMSASAASGLTRVYPPAGQKQTTGSDTSIGGAITALIVIAIFCAIPWYVYLGTNTGDALGHLFWVCWSIAMIPFAIAGITGVIYAIHSLRKEDSGS